MHPRDLLTAAALTPVALAAAKAAPAPASTPGVSLDDMLQPYLANYNLPALAAAVVLSGSIVVAGAVGTRRAGTNDLNTARIMLQPTRDFAMVLATNVGNLGANILHLPVESKAVPAFNNLAKQLYKRFGSAQGGSADARDWLNRRNLLGD
jgi:hypothetical protein